MSDVRQSSFRRKLTAHALVTAGVALVLTVLAVGGHETWAAHHALVRESVVQTDIIAANTAAALLFGDPGSAREVLASLRNEGRVLLACLYDERGALFAHYARDDRREHCPRPQASGHRFNGPKLWVFRKVAYETGTVGTLFLELTLSDLRVKLLRFAVFAVLAGLLGLALAAVVAARLQRSLMRPVGELSRVARLVRDRRDYSARAAVLSNDELGQLTNAFNDMLAHIEGTESVLRQQQKLEAIGTLASGVAHEINNPLTFILGNLEWLHAQLKDATRELSGPKREEIARATAQAVDGALRVREIVAGLNAFARRSDQAPLIPVDVRKALDAAVRIAENKIRHGAVLEADYAEVPSVAGNEGQLTQVFLNLIINALHAMEGRSPRESRLGLRVRATDEHVVVQVSDTGTGIAPEALERIFDPFFTTKAVGTGTGLGLYLCRDIISAMGGRIDVQTAQGVGSTFVVTLPIAKGLPRVSATEPQATPELVSGLRVLVIDDEPAIGDAVTRMLPEHQVVAATSGAAALERLRTQTFDVVLCDVMMPEVSGPSVYERLGALSPPLQRNVVFMTGGAFSDEARAFIAQVPNPVLKKPLNVSELRAAIASCSPQPAPQATTPEAARRNS